MWEVAQLSRDRTSFISFSVDCMTINSFGFYQFYLLSQERAERLCYILCDYLWIRRARDPSEIIPFSKSKMFEMVVCLSVYMCVAHECIVWSPAFGSVLVYKNNIVFFENCEERKK